MSGRSTRRFTYANVMSTIALVVALGGTAAATTTVIVKSNNQVAAGTIAGHHPPAGDHANLIPGSVAGLDLSPVVKSSLTMHCPAGLQAGFDLCFETSTRTPAAFATALSTCSLAGLRLPTIGELAEVYDNTAASQPAQWTDDYYFDGSQTRTVALADDNLRKILFVSVTFGVAAPYRCVVTPTNY
jgi:hypothetical protein